MSEEMIIRHCSPTLAGIKTGNMFSCKYESVQDMRCAVRRFNKKLCSKGLRVVPLKFDGKRALIYIYRPALLTKDLENEAVCELLHRYGYITGTPSHCVVRLVGRLNESDGFPHEIGLFLGYPPEDVKGFIENGCCKCVGCWKVYGDEEAAKKTFAKYKKCTEIYCRLHRQGRGIERLAV